MSMAAKHALRPAARQARGFTLIEVLIAVLVLSIGLLSLALTQANSMRNTHSAYLRSQATLLAGDILDSIRANRSAAEAGAYNIALGTAATGSAVADVDLAAWKANLANLLPAGDGAVARNTATGAITVTVQWKERTTDPSAPPKQFLVSTVP